jgi:hypothetical protein
MSSESAIGPAIACIASDAALASGAEEKRTCTTPISLFEVVRGQRTVTKLRDIQMLFGSHADEWEVRKRAPMVQLLADVGLLEARVLVKCFKTVAHAEGPDDAKEAVGPYDVDGHLPCMHGCECGQDAVLADLVHTHSAQ